MQPSHCGAGSCQSERAQPHARWELTVVDDGSTDATAEFAVSLGDPGVRLFSVAYVGNVLSVHRVPGSGLLQPGAIAGFIGHVHGGRSALATRIPSPIALNLRREDSVDGPSVR